MTRGITARPYLLAQVGLGPATLNLVIFPPLVNVNLNSPGKAESQKKQCFESEKYERCQDSVLELFPTSSGQNFPTKHKDLRNKEEMVDFGSAAPT